jgi:uncharacterized glyoxalase superfamily protein PhnB
MLPSNRSMPSSTVLPEIPYPDIGVAIDRLCSAFGFSLRLRIANHRAQLNVDSDGSGAVILTAARGALSPVSIMVRVADVRAHWERVSGSQAGMQVLNEPTDYPYGERQYSVVDFAGHHWCFSESIADVDPLDWGGSPGQLH